MRKLIKVSLRLIKAFADEDIRDSAVEYLEDCYQKKTEKNGKFHGIMVCLFRLLQVLSSFLMERMLWRIIMFKNYLKITGRIIRRHKGFSFINISSLTIGLTCCILIAVWVSYELSYDKFFPHADEIHRVTLEYTSQNGATMYTTYLPGPLAALLKEEFPEIREAVRFVPLGNLPVRVNEKSLYTQGTCVDPSFFKIFELTSNKVSRENLLPDPLSIVLTRRTAERLFGDEDPLEKTMQFEWWGKWVDGRITGIVENIPPNSHLNYDFFLPTAYIQTYGWDMEKWSDSSYPTYVWLQENSDAKTVGEKVTAYLRQRFEHENIYFHFQPVTRIHLFDLTGGGSITYVRIFTAMGILIFLIACINFMNLSTARSSIRGKEVGMRKAIGSRRSHLIWQFFTESSIFALIAVVLALILAYILMAQMNTLLGLNLSMGFSWKTLLALGGVVVITAVIAGSYPAFFLSAFQPVKVLKGDMGRGSGRSLFRKFLVVAQFTMAVVLMICAIFITMQLHYIRKKDLGFNRENVVRLQLVGSVRSKIETVRQELTQNPNVLSVSAGNYSFLGRSNGVAIDRWEGKAGDEAVGMAIHAVDYDFLKTFDMNMVQGRFFSRDFTTDEKNGFVLNQTAVKAMGLESPVGKSMTCMVGREKREGKIIGVLRDYSVRSLHREFRPVVFVLAPWWAKNIFIKIGPEDVPGTLGFIQTKLRELAPDFPFDYRFLDAEIDQLYRTERHAGVLVKSGTMLAILVACLGLFGLASFTVERRTKEIGIRKVMGASAGRIALKLVEGFAKWIGIASLISWPVAYLAVHQWLENFHFRVGLKLWVFPATGLAALFLAVLTIGYQVVKASRSNPVDSLRYE